MPTTDDAWQRARVAVIGAGGLGCPVALDLAEAGVPFRLIDDDVVELSNLQRQPLYLTADVGRPKVDAATERLGALVRNPGVATAQARLHAGNARELLAGVELVIDCTDDPAAGFVVNDVCAELGLHAVLGGVIQFEGVVLAVAADHGPCMRCVYETAPAAGEVASCATAGVLGAMAGVVGHLQAERAIGLLEGDGSAQTGYVTTIDGRRGRVRHVPWPIDPACPACATRHREQHSTTHTEGAAMAVTIKIPTSLRRFAGGHDHVTVDAADVRGALDGLEGAHPGIKAKICDGDGNLRRFINVYADQEDIRFLDNLDTPLTDGSEIQIVPAIAGG